MLTMIVGPIVAGKWESVGGILLVGGFAFLTVVNDGIPFNAVFTPMLPPKLEDRRGVSALIDSATKGGRLMAAP